MTTFLVQYEEDAAVLRQSGARDVILFGVAGWGGGAVYGDAIVIARGGARELTIGMNLATRGRYIDLGPNGSLEILLEDYSGAEVTAVLKELARDVYWHEEREVDRWDVEERRPGLPSGFNFLDPYLRWTRPEVVVVAGPYGCGKSSFARLLAYRWADTIGRKEDAQVSICAWEDKLSTIKTEVLRYALEGDVKELSLSHAKRLADMESRVRWTQRNPDDARLIDWYCGLVEHRAKYHAVHFFVFDPFNEHDSTRGPHQTETQYVQEMMTKFRKLAHSLGIILVIVTHISAKSYDDNGTIKPFRVANAHGSVHFGNKADRGICIVRMSSLKEVASLNAEDHMVLHFDGQARGDHGPPRHGCLRLRTQDHDVDVRPRCDDGGAEAMVMNFLDAAAGLVSVGFRVFPLVPGGRVPLVKAWQKVASDDDEAIGEWARRWPDANIGVATGVISGVLVIDVDVKDENGQATLDALAKQNKMLPPSPIAPTPSGGRHLFFRAIPGVRNSVQRLLGAGLLQEAARCRPRRALRRRLRGGAAVGGRCWSLSLVGAADDARLSALAGVGIDHAAAETGGAATSIPDQCQGRQHRWRSAACGGCAQWQDSSVRQLSSRWSSTVPAGRMHVAIAPADSDP